MVQPVLQSALALAVVAALIFPAPASAAEPEEILVRFHPGVNGHAQRSLLEQAGATVAATSDRAGWLVVRSVTGQGGVLAALKTSPEVSRAEPNHPVAMTAAIDPVARTWTPTDPWFARQWNLHGIESAWFESRGASAVVVAVLDTGLRASPSEGPATVLPGIDLVNGDADPDDDNGHGTHMASIIAQATDNAARAAGVAPGVGLLPVKVLDAAGHGTVRTVADGIYWATDAGARVINLSLALDPRVSWSEALHDAVAYAAASGVVLVGAAGNWGAPSVSLPAAFNEVIAVGALTAGGAAAPYSSHGAALDLLAPGGDDVDRDGDGQADAIAAWSFDPPSGAEGLYLGAGTSQAAAHVSGAAALLLSLGENGRDRIRSLLELSATPLGDGWSPLTGLGALDIPRACLARAGIPTVAEDSLGGWVPSDGLGDDLFAVLAGTASDPVLLVRDGQGTYGLVSDRPGWVAIHDLGRKDLADLVAEAGDGRAARSLLAGPRLGRFESAGGVVALLDTTGGALRLLGTGGVIALVDTTGGMVALVDSAGGVLSMLETTGGLLGLLSDAGGFIGLVDTTGGVLTLLESTGGQTELVEGSGLTSFGPPAGLRPVSEP